MKTQIQTSNAGFMPRTVAITLLTSNQSKTNGFRKRCFRATERVCEPVSRSTALPISAPKTGAQRLYARLAKATAAQLHRWSKRTLARGNRYQDLLFEAQAGSEEKLAAVLQQQVDAHNGLMDAIKIELTMRSARGKGYKAPVKWAGRYIAS